MRIFTILFITNFIIYGVFAKPDCKLKLQQCENKKPPPRRQVCGTDNQTYPNRCALLRVQCAQNIPLEVKHRGKCKEKQPCWMDQGKKMTARGNSKDPKTAVNFTPECSADGSYAPIQCHKSLGYCWCVTPNGRIIPGTTVHHKKPECPKRGRRGFASKNVSEDGKNSSKKGCDQFDRSIFIKNLLRIFKTEYNKEAFGKHFAAGDNQTALSLEAKAVQYQFFKLDRDKNSSLSRNEYRDLRKLVKRVVKPRRCSRAFIRLCDADRNTIISKQEWTSCLDVNNNQEAIKTTTEEPTSIDTEPEEVDVETHPDPASVLLEESALPLNDHIGEDEEEETGKATDCVSDRKAAMDEFKLGTQGIFVPECTPDGRYMKVQCFRSTGYCWCAFEDTGRPIPGTSSKDSNPNCDTIQSPPRPMKGCPDHKRISFIKDLMEFFKHNMSNANLDDTVNTKDNQRMHEHIASLGFNGLDSDKNKVLERKEWRMFRSMMSTNRVLRRCGRKLPRYCDANHDQKINITEWLQCLSIQNPNTLANLVRPNSNPRRRGPNPLEYLKDDE